MAIHRAMNKVDARAYLTERYRLAVRDHLRAKGVAQVMQRQADEAARRETNAEKQCSRYREALVAEGVGEKEVQALWESVYDEERVG